MFERFFCVGKTFPLFLIIGLFTGVLIVQSCKHQTPPEMIAQGFLDQVNTAVADRSIRAMNELVSPDYHDTNNRNHRDVVGLGSAYLIRSKSLHLFTDLVSAQSISDTSIQFRILAAFAATPVDNKSMLPDINADFYWFNIELIKENGDWKVVSAAWQQAMLEDFLQQ